MLNWDYVELLSNWILLFLFQEEIHELLLSFAEAGATVVRLKGGDPLVSSYTLSSKSYRRFLTCGICNSYIEAYCLYFRCLEGVGRRWIFCNSKEFKCKLFQVQK